MGRLAGIWLMILLLLPRSCAQRGGEEQPVQAEHLPSTVDVRLNHGKYRLYVDGEPFYVKGAGLEFGDLASLHASGANSFRTWRIDNGQRSGREVLDEAQQYGLKVLMGIELGNERHGFDYNDTLAVRRQLEQIKNQVTALKDHPALLAWGIGNELNLRYTNVKVWEAVNEIARAIREIDPHHPTTTMLAGIGKKEVEYLQRYGNDLDFLSIQMYGDIVNLQERIAASGYDGPYMVTEWGATGHWEVPTTEWNAPIEPTSTEKAAVLRLRYEQAILADTLRCLGSYVFLWGQKQELTPTWYGLFTENGDATEAIETMQALWTGLEAENRAPRIIEALLDGKSRNHNIMLAAGREYEARITVTDPDGDGMTVHAEILPESTEQSEGGDREARPAAIDGLILEAQPDHIRFRAPAEQGAYRLFIYVMDGHNHSATVNFPVYVKE